MTSTMIALVTSVFSLALIPVISAAPQRPNIVLIMADDLGYSDLGCYGSEIHTPNLDRLAMGGIRMSQFYNTAKCHTTRASLLTGLYWQQAMRPDKYQLSDHCVTLAEVLGQSGYWTAMAGKWHLSASGVSKQAPLERGFDRFYGTIKGAGSFFDPQSLQRGATPVAPEDGFYYTDAITDEAVQDIQLAAKADKPMFLYVAYTAPHWPLHALPEDIAKYRGVYREGWDAIRQARYARMVQMGLVPQDWALSPRDSADDWKTTPNRDWYERRMEVYAAMVDRMDQGIGHIIKALQQTSQLENTLLMFLSDNGGCSVDVRGKLAANCLGGRLVTRDGQPITTGPVPGVMPGPATTFQAYGAIWANVSNTPYRKYKTSSFEGGIRTPFIMHWPNGIDQPGHIVHEVAHVIDVMPTCVDVAGAKYPAEFNSLSIPPMQGTSLIELTDDSAGKPRTIYQQFSRGAALRYGRWKIVTSNYEGENWALYDMDADGTELHNLANELPDKRSELKHMWQPWADRVTVRR